MRLSIGIIFYLFVFYGCGPDYTEVVNRICQCNEPLMEVNEAIEKAVDSGQQQKVVELFKQAEAEYQVSKECMLNLSNQFGMLDPKMVTRILTDLEDQCPESVELFKESGWYQE